MAEIIQFPRQKRDKEDSKGNGALTVAANFIYEDEKQEMQLRMERIRASLSKINELMRELKQPKG